MFFKNPNCIYNKLNYSIFIYFLFVVTFIGYFPIQEIHKPKYQ